MDEFPGSERHFQPVRSESGIVEKTFVVGSPEHRDHQRQTIDAHVHNACMQIDDFGYFTDDQIAALTAAFQDLGRAVKAALG